MILKISQSMIKAFAAEDYCPMKLKKTYIDKTHDLVPSESMERGVFFETLCLGSGARGKSLTDLPRLKNGNKSTAQQRIEIQAMEFPNVLNAHRISIKEKQLYLEYEFEPGLWMCGEVDFTASIWDDVEGPLPDALVDLKLTANIYSQFGPYCWHFPHNMDHTQAYMYKELYKLVRGQELPFYYLVFDYKPKPEYKIIKKMMGTLERYELQEAIRSTIEKINNHESRGYYTRPLESNCKNCPLAESLCVDATKAKKIITV